MTKVKTTKDELKEGLVSAFPIFIGYLPVALAYGLLAKNSSISLMDTLLFSIMVYAGASQFMALDLIAIGISTGSIVLATFLLNLRHLMMSASLSLDFKDIDRRYLPIVAFGITDETFSVISFNKDKISLPYLLVVTMLSYIVWVLGTAAGYLAGEIIPPTLQSSLGIGLYAMFAALLFPEAKKDKRIFGLVTISAIVYILIYYSKILTSGWDIILGIIISSAICTLIFSKEDDKI